MDQGERDRLADIADRWATPSQIPEGAEALPTPSLVVDVEAVRSNISACVNFFGGAERWRPHVKTTKLAWVAGELLGSGVTKFKCATTRELEMLIGASAPDVLVAMTMHGRNAALVREQANSSTSTTVSILVEGVGDIEQWQGSNVGLFVDVDPEPGRTGIPVDDHRTIVATVAEIARRGLTFRGIHAYEAAPPAGANGAIWVADVLDRVGASIDAVEREGFTVAEVTTSGSISTPWAIGHPIGQRDMLHTMGPGTVVYHDLRTELTSPFSIGLRPAATVLTRVVSSASPGAFTCDAGNKSVAADVGDPIAAIAGRGDMQVRTPSEEHLPVRLEGVAPERGSLLAVVPMHVCPTVNLHDAAVLVSGGSIHSIKPIVARGHDVAQPCDRPCAPPS